MITQRTIQRIVVFIRPARPFIGLLFFPYLVLASYYFLEELPSLRKKFASYRETYLNISKASET